MAQRDADEEYDAETFRLATLMTTRPSVSEDFKSSDVFAVVTVVQNLSYTYDAVGNLTQIEDQALKDVYYGGENVTPECEYTYDAVYRIVEATGRESVGQTDFAPSFDNYRDFPFVGAALNPNDLQALRRYTEEYEYDGAGNMLSFAHGYAGGSWTREFAYEEESLLEPEVLSNRLTSNTVGGSTATYAYNEHGSMKEMSHISGLVWNFKEEFAAANNGGGNRTYYVYDSSGQRLRKVTEAGGVRQKERLYVGGFEIWREYKSDGETVEIERETLHVSDDKQRIALVETLNIFKGDPVSTPASLIRYQLGNHLGSASVELDIDSALITYEEYHPYGTSSFQAGRSGEEMSLKRYRYTTKERDDETGLNYHGARYYAPSLARWTSADDSGISDGLNVFFVMSSTTQ